MNHKNSNVTQRRPISNSNEISNKLISIISQNDRLEPIYKNHITSKELYLRWSRMERLTELKLGWGLLQTRTP